jgi:hypothetical protein
VVKNTNMLTDNMITQCFDVRDGVLINVESIPEPVEFFLKKDIFLI